jgi:hypothetical protein
MINNKSKFLESLSEDEFNDGLIRVGIIDEINNDKISEIVWAYQSKKGDKSTAILANRPISYFQLLHWGSEVKLKYNGDIAIIDNDWIRKEDEELFWDMINGLD